MNTFEIFSYLCTQKRASLLTLGHQCKHHGPRLTADLSAERLRNCSRSAIDASIIALAQPQFWPPNIQLKYVFIMARPIRETPVLKGEDAFNFEMRRLEVENRTPEERAEARRKFQEQVAEASKHIQWCW